MPKTTLNWRISKIKNQNIYRERERKRVYSSIHEVPCILFEHNCYDMLWFEWHGQSLSNDLEKYSSTSNIPMHNYVSNC